MPDAVLALDVGEARIGLARGELGSAFAFGRGWLRRSAGAPGRSADAAADVAADVAAVAEVARSEGAQLLVVGLPHRSDGRDSEQTRRVRAFITALEGAGLRVVTEDERYTTKLATNQLRGSGINRSRRREKGLVDEAAAVLILESYLARNRSPEGSGG